MGRNNEERGGIWTFDAMLPLNKQNSGYKKCKHLARLLRYTDQPYPNIRYLALGKDVANIIVSEGSTFRVDNWSSLFDGAMYFVDTGSFKTVLTREEEIETGLTREITGILDSTRSTEPSSYSYQKRAQTQPEVCVLHVGQGDTILLKLPNGKAWLFDAYAWSNDNYNDLKSRLNQYGVTNIEKLIVTHFHYDHIRRGIDIIGDFNVGEVIVPKHIHRTKTSSKLLAHAKNHSNLTTLVNPAKYEFRVRSNSNPDFTVRLIPTISIGQSQGRSSSSNDNAIVAHLESEFKTGVLAADVPADILRQSLQGLPFSGSTFYKVTHHCSKTGLDEDLMKMIHPSYSVTTCGWRNRYGHPHQQTKTLIDRASHNNHKITRRDGDCSFEF